MTDRLMGPDWNREQAVRRVFRRHDVILRRTGDVYSLDGKGRYTIEELEPMAAELQATEVPKAQRRFRRAT